MYIGIGNCSFTNNGTWTVNDTSITVEIVFAVSASDPNVAKIFDETTYNISIPVFGVNKSYGPGMIVHDTSGGYWKCYQTRTYSVPANVVDYNSPVVFTVTTSNNYESTVVENITRYVRPEPSFAVYGETGSTTATLINTGASLNSNGRRYYTLQYRVGSGEWNNIYNFNPHEPETFTVAGLSSGSTNSVEIRYYGYESNPITYPTVTVSVTTTNETLYGSVNGKSKRVQKLYGSVNGQSKKITKLYASVNGQSKLIYKE